MNPPTGANADSSPSLIWPNIIFFAVWTAATVIAVPWYLITYGIGWAEIAACLVLWYLTGVSITAGYHRLFSHKAYKASAPVRLFFALFGGATFEASIITWAAHHRFHHRYVDTDEDPYDATEGFWHSHMGWLLKRGAKHEDLSNVPDLWKDPICRWQHRYYMAIAIGANVIITLVLGLLTGNMLGMIVFALLLRVLLLHHFTWLINSAAHMWGTQPWSRGHTARDSWLLSVFTFGEGYHNYHHTFQADYRNGPIWYNLDVTKWLIWSLSKLGLAGGLRRIPIEVTLTRRFDQARKDFDARVRELDDRARAIVREHLDPLEKLCEEALARLESTRQSLAAAAREATADRGRDLRKLRGSLRSARERPGGPCGNGSH